MILRNQLRRKLRDRPRGRLLAFLMRALLALPFVLIVAQGPFPGTAGAQEDSVDEYKLKAAMLYHLTQFVEWPGSASLDRHSPINLCILGQDPFANSLASVIPTENDTGRFVHVRHLQSDAEIPGCHILYISSSERKVTARIFSALKGCSTLTVGEMTQFAEHGGMIQFSLEDQHVRFDINVDAASRVGIKISSKLLALAQIVKN